MTELIQDKNNPKVRMKPGTPHDHSGEMKRLRRINGQVECVERMVQERRYCRQIVQQIKPVIADLNCLELKAIFVIILITISSAALAVTPATKTYDLSKQETKVEFTAIGKPNFLKINGTGGKATGTVELDTTNVKANIEVNLNNFKTGVALRDEHMNEKYLETKKYPSAVLTISELNLENAPETTAFSQKNVPFKGKLTVHGIESDVEGKVDIDSTKTAINVIARTSTTITAHKIDLPSYMGIKVADQVDILAEIKIKK